MRSVYITTVDNPYDPADEFYPWYKFDLHHGYNTPGLLARMVGGLSDELSEQVVDELVEDAIDSIVETFDELYVKVIKFEE